MNQFDKICEAAAYLQPYVLPGTKAGVVLGSGLGNFVQEIQMVMTTGTILLRQ